MYIYILEKFKNIHNPNEVYSADTVIKVSDSRHKEILKNMKKKQKNLIREATEEEINSFLKSIQEKDITSNDEETANQEETEGDITSNDEKSLADNEKVEIEEGGDNNDK